MPVFTPPSSTTADGHQLRHVAGCPLLISIPTEELHRHQHSRTEALVASTVACQRCLRPEPMPNPEKVKLRCPELLADLSGQVPAGKEALYLIARPNEKIGYIGKTKNPRTRFASHLRKALKGRTGGAPALLFEALKDEQPVSMEVLDLVPEGEVFEREQALMRDYRDMKGWQIQSLIHRGGRSA